MEPRTVVELKVTLQAVHRFRHAAIILEIDLLIRHTAPQPFHKHGSEDATPSIHAEEHPMGSPRFGQGQARELRALISIEDFRRRSDQRTRQG